MPDVTGEGIGGQGPLEPAERAKAEASRSERIAKAMNRSSFMGLGKNPPKLYSE